MKFSENMREHIANALGNLTRIPDDKLSLELLYDVIAEFDTSFQKAFSENDGDIEKFKSFLGEIITGSTFLNRVFSEGKESTDTEDSVQFKRVTFDYDLNAVLKYAGIIAREREAKELDLADVCYATHQLNAAIIQYAIYSNVKDWLNLVSSLYSNIGIEFKDVMEKGGEYLRIYMDSVLEAQAYRDEENADTEVCGKTEESDNMDDDDFEEDDDAYRNQQMGGFYPNIMLQRKKKFDIGKYCTNLREYVETRKEPLIGRATELDQTIRILCRKDKSNVLHIGEAGVGKTSIALGLARMLNDDTVPSKLSGCQLYSLDVGALVAGARYRGDMEERIQRIIKKLDKMGNAILYIDEIHMLIGAGEGSNGSMDAANLIKKALVESSIRFIGATTFDEYKKNVEKDKAFARRFKNVIVNEPSISETREIIDGIIGYYEEFHNVHYDSEAIDSAIELSVKYIHDKFLPDKAIDLIDEAGASLSKYALKDKQSVTKKIIEDIVAETCNIPAETVSEEDSERIFKLEDEVKCNVFGQDSAISECVKAIKLSRAGLTEPNKPVASLLFVGQTGVGKTEIARQLAKSLNVDFVKFDMSEYMDEISVNKWIGASAGYVGYEDGGLLVETIRKKPNCVLLLDEIEKAHPKVFNILLQVMDDATLTDNKGRKADFKNVILIMTSNAGASGVIHKRLGFGGGEEIDMSQMEKAVEATFTPEFRNRLTKVVALNSMTDDMARKIATKQLNNLVSTLRKQGVSMKYTDSVVNYCVSKGVTKEFGARPIIRVIDNDIKMLMVDDLLAKKKSQFNLDVIDEKVVLV